MPCSGSVSSSSSTNEKDGKISKKFNDLPLTKNLSVSKSACEINNQFRNLRFKEIKDFKPSTKFESVENRIRQKKGPNCLKPAQTKGFCMNDYQLCLFRTKVCKSKVLHNKCELRDECHYSHCLTWNRRNPTLYTYRHTLCPNLKFSSNNGKLKVKNSCKNGRKCDYAHTKEEQMYHHMLYKTQLCTNIDCKKMYCPFAHGKHEIRFPDEIDINYTFNNILPFPRIDYLDLNQNLLGINNPNIIPNMNFFNNQAMNLSTPLTTPHTTTPITTPQRWLGTSSTSSEKKMPAPHYMPATCDPNAVTTSISSQSEPTSYNLLSNFMPTPNFIPDNNKKVDETLNYPSGWPAALHVPNYTSQFQNLI